MILRAIISLLAQFVLFLGCGSPPATRGADNAANAPTTIAVSGSGAAGSHSVALSWDASTSKGVVGYYVYRGTKPGPPYTAFTKLTPSPIAATTYTDSPVEAGAIYYYVVTAVNGGGKESTYSNQASATITSP
jgi:fibronectin type 3 domain-containing protein